MNNYLKTQKQQVGITGQSLTVGLWNPRGLHARAYVASRICVNNLGKVIVSKLPISTDNTELSRTAKIKVDSARHNSHSVLPGENGIFQYPMTVDIGQERPRSWHAISILRYKVEVEEKIMLTAQHYFPVGKAGAKNK